jgi:hypothetical protein
MGKKLVFVTRQIFEIVPRIWYQQLHYQHLSKDFVAVENSGSTIPWYEFPLRGFPDRRKNTQVGVLFAQRYMDIQEA